MCENDIDFQPDELGRDLGGALVASLRPAILDRDSTTIDPVEFVQSLNIGLAQRTLKSLREVAQAPLAMGASRTRRLASSRWWRSRRPKPGAQNRRTIAAFPVV